MILNLKEDASKTRKITYMMKSLSNPGRLAIVDLLLDKNKLTVNEIAQTLNITPSHASQHLKSLESVQILSSQRNGKYNYYFVSNPHARSLLHYINECLAG